MDHFYLVAFGRDEETAHKRKREGIAERKGGEGKKRKKRGGGETLRLVCLSRPPNS